jgi:heme/copper-type cytochrome/quinol oxidase subunit 2
VASLGVTVLTLVAAALEEERPSAADEGRKIITAMLIVGLVFIAVIALGQLSKWAGHRREDRRRRQQAY